MPVLERYSVGSDGQVVVWSPFTDANGMFTLARPNSGGRRNHADNMVKTPSLLEVVRLRARGFSLWMWKGYGRPSLIGPRSIVVR